MLDIFIASVGALMSFAYFPQAWRIYKKKSSKDVSLISYIIFSFGTMSWTVYGFIVNDMVIIIGFILGAIGSNLVLGLTLYYRERFVVYGN